ncbi:MAG TPA: arylmalonate decarboxylase [Deltaproteobacteria bacterium]|mgnify:CR=1 FL=1|nr:arylmalonate decarboxylase [Deltaproteobacteria bacterium]
MVDPEPDIPVIRFDEGPSPRARLGFVILATDETSEVDLYRSSPRGVGLHFNRIESPGDITAQNLSRLMAGIGNTASRILPGSGVDVVSFHCTAGSLLLGERAVQQRLAQACPGALPTTTVSALSHAIEQMKIDAFSLLTPYTDDINEAFVHHFSSQGFRIPRVLGMQLRTDPEITRVSRDTIRAWAKEADHEDADALVISCTGLRSSGLIAELEERLNKPVLTSNQASLWHMLRKAGLDDTIPRLGMLFSH